MAKPKSSRNSSIEAFVVCQGFAPAEGYAAPAVLTSWLDAEYGAGNELLGPNNLVREGRPSRATATNALDRQKWNLVRCLS